MIVTLGLFTKCVYLLFFKKGVLVHGPLIDEEPIDINTIIDLVTGKIKKINLRTDWELTNVEPYAPFLSFSSPKTGKVFVSCKRVMKGLKLADKLSYKCTCGANHTSTPDSHSEWCNAYPHGVNDDFPWEEDQ